MDIVERSHAKALGLTRYFTGKPCPHGHTTERMVSSGACVSCLKLRQRAYYKTGKGKAASKRIRQQPERVERHREYMKDYYLKNKEKWERSWDRAKSDPEAMEAKKKRDAKFRKEYDSRECVKQRRRERQKERSETDPNFALSRALRRRLYMALSSGSRKGSAVSDLGCSIDFLVKHLESKFDRGMSWENYGSWHIDHIKPLAMHDLTDDDQLKQACHYTNLQPLWAEDNLKKGANYETRSDSQKPQPH